VEAAKAGDIVASEEASSGYPLNPLLPEDEGVPPEEDGPVPAAPPSTAPVDEDE
jgi:hypothetical protein